MPGSTAIPMTAPFTVPYTLEETSSTTPSVSPSSPSSSSPSPLDASRQLHLPPPSASVVHAPTDGMAAKMVAGGSACMLISAIMNPMDVVKIRLQTQNQLRAAGTAPSPSSSLPTPHPLPSSPFPSSSTPSSAPSPVHLSMYAESKYKGMTHGLVTIYREEGYARGLMRGVTPSLLREASYSSIRMGLYDFFRSVVAPAGTRKEDFTLVHKIIAGVCSGALGSSLATPIDLMKIRFQLYSHVNPNPYRHTLDAFIQTGRQGGLRGLYKGMGPTTVRAAILNSSSLASYDHTKSVVTKGGYGSDGLGTHVAASLVSGFCMTTASNPMDVIKTRIMTDGVGEAKRYRNAVDCAWRTLRSEGLKAFSKGWLPNYLRLGPHALFSLPLAEFIRVQLGADTY